MTHCSNALRLVISGERDIVLTLRPLIAWGLIKKRGLAIFPEEINGEGGNKWKWVNFVVQFLNRGFSIVGAVALIFLKVMLKRYYDTKRYYTNSYNIFDRCI